MGVVDRAAAAARPLPRLTLITGPSGSGKSRWAEHLAAESLQPVVYLATGPALPDDPSWQDRLQRHRQRRPSHWRCLEVGPHLTAALAGLAPGELGLVDALGTWVAAHLEEPAEAWQQLVEALEQQLARCPGPLLLVGDEVSWGVVPATALGCRFRDRLAALQRRLALQVEDSWLVVQGRALNLHQLEIAVPS